MNRLKEHYQKTVVPALQKGFSYKNPHQVPRLVKIVVSMGVGSATQNKAILDNAVKDMEQITGRKAIVTKARKSISNFKLRQGMPIGCKVTLRGEVMYEFLDRLISIVIPRLRDFHGSRLVVGGMLTGQGPDRGAGLLPGSGDRLDGLVRILGQGGDQAGHGRVQRHRPVDPWFGAQGGEVTQRFTAEHQRQSQIADDLARVVDRQRFPPPGQRLRQCPVEAGGADGFGQ